MRGMALALLAVLAILFAPHARKSRTALLGTLVTAGGICYLFLMAIPPNHVQVWWRIPFHLMSLITPGLFWLFALSWFDDEFELRPWHILTVLCVAVIGLLHVALFFQHEPHGLATGLIWRGSGLLLVGHGIWTAIRGRTDDLIESRRKVRLRVAVAVGIAILLIVFSELAVTAWPPPPLWKLGNSLILCVLAAGLLLSLVQLRDRDLLYPATTAPAPEEEEQPSASPLPVDVALLQRLTDLMQGERLYRQEGLAIGTVAAKLAVPEYRLRRAINQGLGARNFNAYLNGFRLEEAMAALADSSQREVPVLTIALDAGFGSLAPFNRAFKQETAMTPTEYREKYLGKSATA